MASRKVLRIETGPAATGNGETAALRKRDFAARYGVGRRLVEKWMTLGLPHLKLSSRMVRIPLAPADAWLRDHFQQQRRGKAPLRERVCMPRKAGGAA